MSQTLRDIAHLATESSEDGLRIINMTGHDVTIHVGRQVITFAAGTIAARVEYINRDVAPLPWSDDDGAPVLLPRRQVSRGRLLYLPEPTPGVYLLVSRIVASYAGDRTDLLVPDGVMRDSRGHTFACTFLTRVLA